MQDNYEYLKDTSGSPLKLEFIVGRYIEFKFDYFPLFEDLRTIEDSYSLMKKLNMLLMDPNMNNLSNIELKIGLRSCADAIVQSVCRLLETPNERYFEHTNCIYTRILDDIKDEDKKQKALTLHQELVDQPWYESLQDVRNKRVSHQEENIFNTYSVPLIKELLTKPELMQYVINAIAELLEFCASANLNGGRAKYIFREQP